MTVWHSILVIVANKALLEIWQREGFDKEKIQIKFQGCLDCLNSKRKVKTLLQMEEGFLIIISTITFVISLKVVLHGILDMP